MARVPSLSYGRRAAGRQDAALVEFVELLTDALEIPEVRALLAEKLADEQRRSARAQSVPLPSTSPPSGRQQPHPSGRGGARRG